MVLRNRFSINYDPTELVLSVGASPPGTNIQNFLAEVQGSGLGTFIDTDSQHEGTSDEARTVSRGQIRALFRLDDLDNPLSTVNIPVPMLLPMLGSMEFDCRDEAGPYVSLKVTVPCNGITQLGAMRIDWPV